MLTFEFRSWTVEVDSAATAAVYAQLRPAADTCGCASCRNFAAARPAVFPPEALALLRQLGVDPVRETSLVGYGDEGASGQPQFYEGAFRFVGRVQDREGGWPSAANAEFHGLPALGPAFGLGFTEAGEEGARPVEAFAAHPTAVVSFAAVVPWLLERPHAEPADGAER